MLSALKARLPLRGLVQQHLRLVFGAYLKNGCYYQ